MDKLVQFVVNVCEAIKNALYGGNDFHVIIPGGKEGNARLNVLTPKSMFGTNLSVNPLVILGQACWETGYGSRAHGILEFPGHKDHGKMVFSNNLFGIKWTTKSDRPYVEARTFEYSNGKKFTVSARFVYYPSFEDSIKHYASLINGLPRYEKAAKNAHNPYLFAFYVAEGGWATDPKYYTHITSMLYYAGLRYPPFNRNRGLFVDYLEKQFDEASNVENKIFTRTSRPWLSKG